MVADADFLFTTHRDGVFRYLSRIVGQGDASELTQEVFLRVARGPLPPAEPGARRAWIFSIARNLALNHVRDDRRRGVSVSSTRDRRRRRRNCPRRWRKPSTGWRRSIATFS